MEEKNTDSKNTSSETNSHSKDPTALRSELRELQSQSSILKKDLSALNKSKEEAYRARMCLKDKMKARNQKIQDLKTKRNEFSTKVKENKVQRDTLNTTVRKTGSQVQDVKDKFGEDSLKTARSSSHSSSRGYQRRNKEKTAPQIKKEIEDLETKIETEPMPFYKEKEIRKTIKELASKLKKMQVKVTAQAVAGVAVKEHHHARKKAQVAHQKVQEFAKLSQEKHEEINLALSEVKNFRKEKDNSAKTYGEHKDQWQGKKEELDKIQLRIKELKEALGEKSQANFKEQLKERASAARQKLKTGGKLTVEDLLAMQALDP